MLIAVLFGLTKFFGFVAGVYAVAKASRPQHRQLVRDVIKTALGSWPEPKPEPMEFIPHNKLAWCEICEGKPEPLNDGRTYNPAANRWRMQQNAGMGWSNYKSHNGATFPSYTIGPTGRVHFDTPVATTAEAEQMYAQIEEQKKKFLDQLESEAQMVANLKTDIPFVQQQSTIRQLRESMEKRCPRCGNMFTTYRTTKSGVGLWDCVSCKRSWSEESMRKFPTSVCATCGARTYPVGGPCQSDFCKSRDMRPIGTMRPFEYAAPQTTEGMGPK